MLPSLARASTVVALCVAAAVMSGCSTPAAPVDPAPVFSSDAEAFAAAEATYRAYVDALNDVDLSDPATFEPVFALTTGEANANERKNLSTMHADGWVVVGDSRVTRVDELEAQPDSGNVSLGACIDVTDVSLADRSGESQVSPDRPPVQSVRVSLVALETGAFGLAIAEITGYVLDPACS